MTHPFKMKICLILHQAMELTSFCHYTLDICPLKCLLHTKAELETHNFETDSKWGKEGEFPSHGI
jgi:formate hydrogenlyase subunit 6/NADH:ubiquinone oxidoreductase subunit I